MGYLLTLILLGLLILIHEAGHLVAARLVGIPVAEFAVGFGPRLCWRRWGQTVYSLRAFPLGGFVLPAVESDAELRAFALRKRLGFFFAGPLANLTLAVPLFAVLNGRLSADAMIIGPFRQIAGTVWGMLSALPGMVMHPGSMMGVIGIVAQGGQMAQAGMVLEMALSLTISLAVLNLLPIPGLDGGQILMSCLEEVFPRLVRFRTAITMVGLFLLVGVMIYTNIHDVLRSGCEAGRPVRSRRLTYRRAPVVLGLGRGGRQPINSYGRWNRLGTGSYGEFAASRPSRAASLARCQRRPDASACACRRASIKKLGGSPAQPSGSAPSIERARGRSCRRPSRSFGGMVPLRTARTTAWKNTGPNASCCAQ